MHMPVRTAQYSLAAAPSALAVDLRNTAILGGGFCLALSMRLLEKSKETKDTAKNGGDTGVGAKTVRLGGTHPQTLDSASLAR